tara:strand:- start:227 stop:847 length:621 start_codon:yes stop_codon:yes gene_type:complete
MSQIKLKHSGGNSVIIAAPDSNPASDRTLKLPSNADGTVLTTTNPKAGNIIQVVSTTKTDSFSTTSSSYVDITGMTVSITPQSNNSKILLEVILNYGGAVNMYGGIKVLRDSTHIGVSTAVSLGNQVNASFGLGTLSADSVNSDFKLLTAAFKILDTPSTTNAITYKLQVYTRGTVEFNLNRPNGNHNDVYVIGGTSSITAQEVAG